MRLTPNENAREIGLKIRSLREERKLSVREMEGPTCLRDSHIRNIENGYRNLQFDHLDGFASALGMTRADFARAVGVENLLAALEKDAEDEDDPELARAS